MKTIKKVINGVEYTAVWKGINFSNENIKQCTIKNTNLLSTSKLAKFVFDNIIINPKVDIDSFDDISEFSAVLDFGKSVLFGTFEDDKSKTKLKREIENEWGAWRLIFCDMANFDYDTVFNQLTPQEIQKANIALDIVNDQIKKSSKKK